MVEIFYKGTKAHLKIEPVFYFVVLQFKLRFMND